MTDALPEVLGVGVSALAGTLVAAPLACVPGLHIYNVMGAAVLALHAAAARGVSASPEAVAAFGMGMVVGYAMLSTVPSVLLAAPDESALFMVLPGQKRLAMGLGYEAVMITTLGGMAGLLALALVAGPLAPRVLPAATAVLRPHLHWVLWCVIAFMLMSEWPKGGGMGQGGWRKFLDGWKSPAAGLLTFVLSGLLGFILIYRSPLPVSAGFHNLVPAFVGLFTFPWLFMNLTTRLTIPPQTRTCPTPLDVSSVAAGSLAGALGGGLAAFLPAVTGGVGGLLAGHATAIRDDRSFLVSQGASKVVYYAGALLLSAVPGTGLTRGAAAGYLRGLVVFQGRHDYVMTLAALALSGALAGLLVSPLARGTLKLMARWGYPRISAAALAVMVMLVLLLTGWKGLGVAVVAGAIGLIPVLFGARRSNTLGIVLLPVACGLSDLGGTVAGWLGLI